MNQALHLAPEFNTGHYFGGSWHQGEGEVFTSTPAQGSSYHFRSANKQEVDQAVLLAESCFLHFSNSSRQKRSQLLMRIAELMDLAEPDITALCVAETGLSQQRMRQELERTSHQLRVFGQLILTEQWRDQRHDPALAQIRPSLHLISKAVGPVAVFSASNFPLAFSVAGGDTASALAAGCPVIVKAHQAHPATSALVARLIGQAISEIELPAGIFAMLQSATRQTGEALVTHPLIKAVGFTGSTKGGRALFNLCAAREEPIPFYGELGSLNPLIILPNAGLARAEQIAEKWVTSITNGAGQFCTKPGLLVLPSGEITGRFKNAAIEAMALVPVQTMLSPQIAQGFLQSVHALEVHSEVKMLVSGHSDENRCSAPWLFHTSAKAYLADHELSQERFGPAALIVSYDDQSDVVALIDQLEGQLTATVHGDYADYQLAQSLLPLLERKAGRLIWNGFPTGVAVSQAMVHGGPYPASTNFGHSAVGTIAIRRWLRALCYQDLPADLLASLMDSN